MSPVKEEEGGYSSPENGIDDIPVALENSPNISTYSREKSEGRISPPPLPNMWTVDEDKLLEEGLKSFPQEKFPALLRLLKIAATIPSKTTRDVAIRKKWLQLKQEGVKRKRGEEGGALRKPRDRKNAAAAGAAASKQTVETTATATSGSGGGGSARGRTGGEGSQEGDEEDGGGGTTRSVEGGEDSQPSALPPLPPVYSTSQALHQNEEIISQIKTNLGAFKVNDSQDLFCRLRDNLLGVLEGMTSMPGIMSQMPPLPVKLNLDLASHILPPRLDPPPLFPHM